MGQAVVALLWERHGYSRIEGEAFADVRGIGRFSIRKAKGAPGGFSLKLNGKHICSSSSSLQLQFDAREIVRQKMQEQGAQCDE